VLGGGIGIEDGQGLELEAEIADPRQQPVQLGLVGNLADQFGGARAADRRHAVEGGRQALAQPSMDRDPDAQMRVHGLTIRPACVRPHHARPLSRRAIGARPSTR